MFIYIITFPRKNNHIYKPLSSNALYIVGIQELFPEFIIDEKCKKKNTVQRDSSSFKIKQHF